MLAALTIATAYAALANQSAFSEYLSKARRCTELGDCPTHGGKTGAMPLYHGALWIRVLAFAERAGHDLTWVQSLVGVTWLLSLPLTFSLLLRHGIQAAALALGLYLPVVLVCTDIGDLTYTSLLPLPWAVYYVSLARFVERGRLAAVAVASLALAVAVSAELGCIVMVPFHGLIVLLTAPRPLPAVAVAAFGFGIAFGLESTDAALEIARQVPTVRFAIAIGISGAILALATRRGVRARFAVSVPATERLRTVMLAALAYAVVTIWLVSVVLMDDVPAPRYLPPAGFPFLFLLAERLGTLAPRAALALAAGEAIALLLLWSAPGGGPLLQVPVAALIALGGIGALVRLAAVRRPAPLWPAVVIVVCTAAFALADHVVAARRGARQHLTMREAEPLVAGLYGAGYTYGQLLGALQGPLADDLLALATERDPQRFAEPPVPAAPAAALLLTRVPPDPAAPIPGVIAAGHNGAGRVAVVRAEPGYLDWLHARRCRWERTGGQPPEYRCAEPRRAAPVPHNWPWVEYGEPAPAAPPPDAAAPDGNTKIVRYEVPVRTPGRGRPHVVRVADQWPATWRIVRVTGVPYEGELPGPEVRLTDATAGEGLLELEFVSSSPRPPWVWIPRLLEVGPEHETLLAPLRRSGAES